MRTKYRYPVHEMFKKVINLAIANEWLTKNPFAGIKFHEVEVNKQFLSQAEINRIWQKEFKIERLELVRDVFIFCVYTGLAFIDVYNLHPEHISEDGNGNLWIVKPREKTNNLCNIPLLSIPKQILEKYKDNPYAWIKELYYPFPAIEDEQLPERDCRPVRYQKEPDHAHSPP